MRINTKIVLPIFLTFLSLFIYSVLTSNKSVVFKNTYEKYIFLGDTGIGDKFQYSVADAIKNFCSGNNCNSAYILGDVIYNKGVSSVSDDQFFTKFEDPYRGVDLTFYITFGNHDYFGCTDCYLEYSSISAKWKMPSHFYKKSTKNIGFFIINTENFNQVQQNWLIQEINKSKEKYKIVLGHRPLKTYEFAHTGENWEGKESLKNIICNRADFYISGHSHILEDVGQLENCSVRQIISGAGGATIRPLINQAHSKYAYEGHGFISIFVNNKGRLTMDFLNTKSQVIYSINK